jgi:hypothetical protein
LTVSSTSVATVAYWNTTHATHPIGGHAQAMKGPQMNPSTNRGLRSRHRPPAVASAFTAAFLLGSLAAFIYFVAQGQPFLKHFTGRQCLIYAAFIVIPWLLFWILIAVRRRRSG